MDRFLRTELRRLIEIRHSPCVSFYMPTARTGRETQQASIRCRNLLNEATDKLLNLGLRRPDAEGILEPIAALQRDDYFWNYQSDALAMFATEGQFFRYRLPLDFDERVVVSDRFHIKPLLPMLQTGGQFLLLTVSQNRVRLFEATPSALSEFSTDVLPSELAQVLVPEESQKSLQLRTLRTAVLAGERVNEAIFHGPQGERMAPEIRDELVRYFGRLNESLQAFLEDETAPLVYVGVDYFFPFFQETNHYRYLLDQPVPGNPDNWEKQVLHSRAWAVVRPRFERQLRDAVQRYSEYAGHQRSIADLEAITVAAREGRVDTLFAASDRHYWGTIDNAGRITPRDQERPDAEDIVDLAIVETLVRGGQVYAVPAEQLPAGDYAAAVLRFANPAADAQLFELQRESGH